MPEPPWANSPYVDKKYWFDPNPPKEAFANLPKCCGKCKSETNQEEFIEGIEEILADLDSIIHHSEKLLISEKIDIIANCLYDLLIDLKDLSNKIYDTSK